MPSSFPALGAGRLARAVANVGAAVVSSMCVARPLIDRAESGDCACVWTVVSVVCVRDLDDLRVSETHGHSVRVTAT